MTSQQVLTQLKKLGRPKTATTYARHGVSGACYGVSYGDLKPLVKKIGKNHAMALELWKSGVHDARIAATMIAEPQKMTRAEIENWLGECKELRPDGCRCRSCSGDARRVEHCARLDRTEG